jgi:methylmalonyl-CoA mutase C-terminal domain/subunit
MQRPIRFLLCRDDLTHQRGYWIIASALRQAGVEVILGGKQFPEEVVKTAIHEDVDMIGYHVMQGAPKVLVPILLEQLEEKGAKDIPVVVGGIIPEKDEAIIREAGVRDVFHPLTSLEDIVERIKDIASNAY